MSDMKKMFFYLSTCAIMGFFFSFFFHVTTRAMFYSFIAVVFASKK
jgi:hypothetical protein